MSEEPEAAEDLVKATFDSMRRHVKRSGRTLPPLGVGRNKAPRRALVEREKGSSKSSNDEGVELFPGFSLDRPKYREYMQRGVRPSGPDGRRKPRSLDVATVGSVLSNEISKRGWAYEISTSWVTSSWPSLVGENVAAHTKVRMVKDNKLFISCDTTAWATNLRYMQSFVLSKIAESVGPGIITELKIFGPDKPSWRKGKLHVKGRGPRDTYG